MSALVPGLERELERLRELTNIGASWAAGAFGRLVARPVLTDVPAPYALEAQWTHGRWETGVFFEVEGDFEGLVAFFLPPDASAVIVRELVGHVGGELGPEAWSSALCELGNIVAAQSISAIANTLNGRAVPSVPEVVRERAVDAFGDRLVAWRERGAEVRLESELFDRGGELMALLVFVPLR